MLLHVSVLLYVCTFFNCTDQPKDISTIQPGLIIQLTNQGLNKYVTKNMRFSGDWLMQIQLPDLNIPVHQFDLLFTDIRVSGYHLPNCAAFFKKDGAEFTANDLTIILKANFRIKQVVYPYFEDQGEATLKVFGMDVAGYVKLDFSPDCPLHYYLNVDNPIMTVRNIIVTLDGDLSFIYNSILAALTQQLIQEFSQTLGPLITNAIMQLANDQLGDYDNFSNNGLYDSSIGTDQQPISGSVNPDFLTLNTVGQTLVYDINDNTLERTIYGYQNYTYSQLPNIVTNDHIQYKVNYLLFQGNFEKLITRGKINDNNDTMKVTDVTVKGFSNTGLETLVTVSFKNNSYTVETNMNIQATPMFYTSPTVNHTLIYVSSINMLSITNDGQHSDIDDNTKAQIQITMDKVANATQYYGIQISNSNGINECNTLVMNKDWMHVGCMIYDDD